MNDERNSQDDVFAFLADPATHGGHKVRRIDTHAASVFLAGDRALNQGDGVHPTAEGQRIVADTVWGALEPVLTALEDRLRRRRGNGL